MVEPITAFTASTIAGLVFGKAVEKTVEKFTEAALAKMEKLRQKIWERLRGNPNAEAALTAAEQGDKKALEKVEGYLNFAMLEDEEFASEVKVLAQEIHAGKRQDNSSMTQNNHDNARGWQTKVEGGTAYVGEINFHGKPPQS